MATVAYPLDNTEYYAEDARLFHVGRKAGIFNVTGEDLRVYVSSRTDRQVTVTPGYAYLFTNTEAGNALRGGIVFASDSSETFTVDEATSDTRYDYIALRYSATTGTCALTYVKGTTSVPTPVRSSTEWELIFCIITVKTSDAGILYSSRLQDVRLDETYCGLVVDTCASIDTQAFQDQFTSFMEEIDKKLSDDEINKLSNRITAVETTASALNTTTGKLDTRLTAAEKAATELSNTVNSQAESISTLEQRQEIKYKVGTATPTTSTCPVGYFYFKLES